MVKKSEETTKKVKIKMDPIQIGEMQLKVVGTTPLLMEKMAERIREQLKNIQEGKGKEKNKNRDFENEVLEKIHKDEKGNVGFPASGFKKAMVETAPYIDGLDKKLCKGSFFVIGDLNGDLVSIKFKKQVINKSVGRDSGINRSPREIWRPEFQEWSAILKIRYNASQINAEQIMQLCKLSGFHIGVGSWNPQHSGSYGMFTLA